MLLIEGDRPVYAAPAIHLSPKHARGCARRVNKRRSRRTQTCRWDLDRAADVIPAAAWAAYPLMSSSSSGTS